MPSKPTIVDISHWQSEPDFKKVKAGGILGIILKATEGTGYTDPTYWPRRDKATAAGLATSSYHFLKHGKVKEQIEYFLGVVQPVQGERVVIDYEDAACTLDDLTAAVNAINDDSRGLQCTIYGANGFLGAQLKGQHNPLFAACSLWVASYTSAAQPTMTNLSGTWPAWTCWQFSDKSPVDGFSAPVDGNVFNGSDTNLLKWLNPASSSPIPVPTPDGGDVPTLAVTLECDTPVKLVLSLGANVTWKE